MKIYINQPIVNDLVNIKTRKEMKAEVQIGYYWVKFYNHEERKIMYYNGKSFERFESDPMIHDEIESYSTVSHHSKIEAIKAEFTDEWIWQYAFDKHGKVEDIPAAITDGSFIEGAKAMRYEILNRLEK